MVLLIVVLLVMLLRLYNYFLVLLMHNKMKHLHEDVLVDRMSMSMSICNDWTYGRNWKKKRFDVVVVAGLQV